MDGGIWGWASSNADTHQEADETVAVEEEPELTKLEEAKRGRLPILDQALHDQFQAVAAARAERKAQAEAVAAQVTKAIEETPLQTPDPPIDPAPEAEPKPDAPEPELEPEDPARYSRRIKNQGET